MRARNLIFLLLAVIAAVGTAMLARGWVNAQRSDAVTIAAPAQEASSQFVLVTTQALPAGKLLGKDDVRWQPWPEDGLNQAYIVKGAQDIEAFVGAVVRRSLAPGEPITEGRIALPGERGFLAAMLTPGMRAISVPVNATSGISGLVFPGDRVDLILTHTFSQGTESEPMPRRASETVLRNIRVLAVDQRTDDQDGQPIVAKTATLEVTAKQAEKIAMLTELGRLALTLRSLGSDSGQATADSDSHGDAQRQRHYTLDSEVSPLLNPPRATRRQPVVEVNLVRGSESQTLSFAEGDRR